MKIRKTHFLLLTMVLICPILRSQEKNCNSVNIPGNKCNIKILYENSDTIKGIIEDDCFDINYDLSKNVTWLIYFADMRQLKEQISFCNGKKTQLHKAYYANGKLKCTEYYENGELTGPYICFYENGAIHLSGTYTKDKFLGTRYLYWDNGMIAEVRIQTETSYWNKYVNFYDPFGNSISEKEFKQSWYCDPWNNPEK